MIARLVALAAVFAGVFGVQDAMAAEPKNWQLGFQEAATPTMEKIDGFHDFVTIIATVIAVFVMVLLLIVIFRFNEKSNPTPTTTTHHLPLEIAWTVIPIIILVVMAIPSFKLMYFADRVDNPDMTLKIIGRQWYWSYEYSDYCSLEGGESLNFDSYMIPEEDLTGGGLRLLEVDNRLVLPVNTHIRVLVTAADVLHSWAIPSFGVKIDACPGRLNQTSMFIKREGVYYGQCSEICGVNHGFMPIVVEAVNLENYVSWIADKLDGLELS